MTAHRFAGPCADFVASSKLLILASNGFRKALFTRLPALVVSLAALTV